MRKLLLFIILFIFNNLHSMSRSTSIYGHIIFGDLKNVISFIASHPSFDLNELDENGYSCLHYACESERENIVKFLFNQCVDLNVVDKEGFTPFDYAFEAQYYNIICLFLEKFKSRKLEIDIYEYFNYAIKNKLSRSISALLDCGIEVTKKQLLLASKVYKTNLALGKSSGEIKGYTNTLLLLISSYKKKHKDFNSKKLW
ncbi:hypothetical protein GF385_01590 [Candidatus Dependentiae bacterium]|nr:hypothetical protein [Candidatus Dependentiae bacterium]